MILEVSPFLGSPFNFSPLPFIILGLETFPPTIPSGNLTSSVGLSNNFVAIFVLSKLIVNVVLFVWRVEKFILLEFTITFVSGSNNNISEFLTTPFTTESFFILFISSTLTI